MDVGEIDGRDRGEKEVFQGDGGLQGVVGGGELLCQLPAASNLQRGEFV